MTQENQATTSISGTSNLPQAPEQIQGGGWTSLVPMVLIFVVFYFLLIKPQEKKRKQQEQLVSTVKPGEEIITHSGIYGKVVRVNENDGTAIISIGNNVEVKILKSSIADIPSRKTQIEKPSVKTEKATAAPAKPAAKTTPASTTKKPAAKPISKAPAKPAAKKPVAKSNKPGKKAK